MGNKKNPNYTDKAIEVTDKSTGKVALYQAKQSKTALAHAKREAVKEAVESVNARFSARVLSPKEIMALRNPKYIDLTGTTEDAPVDPAQIDIEYAIHEAEAQADADAGAGEAEEQEQATHGAIFQ